MRSGLRLGCGLEEHQPVGDAYTYDSLMLFSLRARLCKQARQLAGCNALLFLATPAHPAYCVCSAPGLCPSLSRSWHKHRSSSWQALMSAQLRLRHALARSTCNVLYV